MIKKQIGFQVAIFDIPGDYTTMREDIQHLQKSGWEVISTENLALAKDPASGRDVERLAVTLVKYEWVDETARMAVEEVPKVEVVAKKSPGRPKKEGSK